MGVMTFPDAYADLEAATIRRDLVDRCLSALAIRDRWIVKRHFGLAGDCPLEQGEIAELLGVTAPRVWQCVHRAIRKMRRVARSDRPDYWHYKT